MEQDVYQNVLDFWFGPLEHEEDLHMEKSQRWFAKDHTLDFEIEEKFFSLLEKGAKNHLNHWKETPRGHLALIILLDQFSRNIFRGSSQAFAYDEKALALCLEGIEQGIDKQLFPIERAFFYMPLQHSESLDIQKQSIRCFEDLLESAPVSLKARFEMFLKYAIAHHDIIARFKRYPHRNETLKRESTEEERLFLQEAGSSF